MSTRPPPSHAPVSNLARLRAELEAVRAWREAESATSTINWRPLPELNEAHYFRLLSTGRLAPGLVQSLEGRTAHMWSEGDHFGRGRGR